METVYNSPIPLDTNWNQYEHTDCSVRLYFISLPHRRQLLAAATFYIDSLLHQLEPYLGVHPQKYLQRLYQQR